MKILLPYFKRYKKDVFLTLITIVFSAFATLYQPRLLLAMLQCSEGDAAKHGACPN